MVTSMSRPGRRTSRACGGVRVAALAVAAALTGATAQTGRLAAVERRELVAVSLAGATAQAAPAAPAAAQDPRAVLDRAIDDFAAGRLAEAASGFDVVAALVPAAAPQLWQRGIALYYVGRYQDCREMFESHRLVNPNDVENAAWHFLCVARAESPAAARAALLPVGPDSRAPMREVYRLFQGQLSPADVLAAGEQAAGRGRTSGLFFAHLYIGLHHEALGNADAARTHLEAAADDRFAPAGGYMHMVARVHVADLDRRGR